MMMELGDKNTRRMLRPLIREIVFTCHLMIIIPTRLHNSESGCSVSFARVTWIFDAFTNKNMSSARPKQQINTSEY